jgi:hypothetical protein
MRNRRRLVATVTAGALALATMITTVGPVSAASATVVSSAPCTVTGSYRAVSKGSNPGENAYYSKCTSGGFTYLRPFCRAQSGDDKAVDLYIFPANITLDECYIFVWTTSGGYVTRFGFNNYTVSPMPQRTYSAYYVPTAGYLKLSGYYVSTEVCATSRYWYQAFDMQAKYIGCVQSTYGSP